MKYEKPDAKPADPEADNAFIAGLLETLRPKPTPAE
jgi:hypothetical protein